MFGSAVIARPAAAGGSFSPLDLSPAAWYDASDSATITESGGLISAWNDKSGNANHLAQATGANQPTYTSAGQNGKNVVTFDGTSDIMRCTPGATIGTAALTKILVYSRNTTTDPTLTAPPLLMTNGTNSAGPLDHYQSGAQNRYTIGAASSISASWFDMRNSADTCLVHEIVAVKDSGGAGIHGVTEYINGTLHNTANITATWSTASQTINVGARPDLATLFAGYLCEAVVLNTTLSAGERSSFSSYSASKWGTP